MKRVTILSLFAFLNSALLFGNTGQKVTLSGKVTDKSNGSALPFASIYIPDLKIPASSDVNGAYKIENLPASRLLIQVSYAGYNTIVETIDLSQTITRDFALEPSIKEIPEFVVTGTSKATELKKNPVPTILINPQFITQNATTNAIDILNKIPGVSTLTTGPNVSKPYIHGLGYNRVLTLFDGVRQEGQQWGDEHGVEVDQFLIDHIEVVKGPSSLMYGSDAIAGVVNLLPAHFASYGTVTGSLLGNYQSNNRQVASSFAMDGNTKGKIWGFRFSHKQASDYRNKYDGAVYGTKFNEWDANAYLGVNRSWGYSHLNFSLYDNLQEIPDGSRDSLTRKFTKQVSEADTIRPIVSDQELNDYSIAAVHQHVQHYRFYSANNFVFTRSKLALNLGFQESIRREFSHPQYTDIAGLYLILNTLSYDVKYYLPELKNWETTVGANGMYQLNNAGKGTEFVIPSYHAFDLGPFAHINRSFDKITLSGGVRYDMRMYANDALYTKPNAQTGFDMSTAPNTSDTTTVKQFDAYSHTFGGISASLGSAYNINDKFTLKLNVSRGYRAPNAAEISAKGVHPGTGFEQLGDANFKPEFSLQEDIGLFFSSKHLSASLEAFNNDISNYIYDEKLNSVHGGDSLFIQDGNPYPVFKFRQTTAQLLGGEFGFDIHPHPLDWLHFENSVSYIYAVNKGGNGASITDSTKYLPLIPPLHTISELRADIKKKVKCFSSIFIKAGVQWYSAQDHFYGAYGTETRTPGYTLIDAGFGANVVNKKDQVLFTISILGTNLADVAYQSNMNRLKYFDNYPVNGTGRSGIYNMGRNISFKLVMPFDLTKKKNTGEEG